MTDLYNNVFEGHDFSYFQDCNYNPEDTTHGYEEHYFNPDHVIIFPDNKEFFWFDLDYTTVSYYDLHRMHQYGNFNFKRKFAFSSLSSLN